MYEALRALRQLLHQYVEALALLGHGLRQVLDTLGVGPYPLPYAQQVWAGNLHVAALGPCVAVPRHGVQRVDLEEVLEDGFVDERLALAHLEAHRVDEHTVVDGAARVAGEEEVVEGLEQVAVVRCAVPFGVFKTLDEHPGQVVRRHIHQLLAEVVVAVVHVAALFYEVATYITVFQQFFKHIFYIIDVRPLLQHTAEGGIFLVHYRFVQDIAVQRMRCIQGSHAFNLHAGTVQQHSTQPTSLRRHIHPARFQSVSFHIVLSIITLTADLHQPTAYNRECKYTKKNPIKDNKTKKNRNSETGTHHPQAIPPRPNRPPLKTQNSKLLTPSPPERPLFGLPIASGAWMAEGGPKRGRRGAEGALSNRLSIRPYCGTH